jgi:hypothetical protein
VRCEEFETRLNDLIDERVEPSADATLAAHAAECAACATLLREYAALLNGVTMLPRPAVPAGLSLRVVADWRAVPRREAFRPRVRVLLAMAAALLVAAIPAVSWLLRSPSPGASQGTQLAVADDTATPVISRDENDIALVDQARETYEPLISATNESLTSVLNALPDSGDATPNAANLDDAVLDRDVTSSLGPVAVSASRSVASLLRVLPGSARAIDDRGISQ